MRAIIEGMTAKTLKRDRKRLLELVAAVMGKGKMLKAESMMKGGVTAWVCA